jgi:hypothetical protein
MAGRIASATDAPEDEIVASSILLPGEVPEETGREAGQVAQRPVSSVCTVSATTVA